MSRLLQCSSIVFTFNVISFCHLSSFCVTSFNDMCSVLFAETDAQPFLQQQISLNYGWISAWKHISCSFNMHLMQKYMYCILAPAWHSFIYLTWRKQPEDVWYFCIKAHTHTHTHQSTSFVCWEHGVLRCALFPVLKAVAEIVGEGLDLLLHTMAGVVFVTTETIRFLATFPSSPADSKIKSNDGIPAVDWKKNVCEQSAGY